MSDDGGMAPKVHVGGGVYAPVTIDVADEQLGSLALEVAITAKLALDGRRYVVNEMTFTRRPDGPPVTGEVIRRVPVHTVLQFAMLTEVEMFRDGVSSVLLPPELLRRVRADGPTDETLAVVAQLYIFAELAGDPPAKNVSAVLGIPISTANNWIRRSKDRGYFDVEKDGE